MKRGREGGVGKKWIKREKDMSVRRGRERIRVRIGSS
jgi:hypothetical protein